MQMLRDSKVLSQQSKNGGVTHKSEAPNSINEMNSSK